MVFRNNSDGEVSPLKVLGRDQVPMTDFISAFNASALYSTLDWCRACNQTTSINGCDGLLFEANATAKALVANGGSASATSTASASGGGGDHFSAVGAGFIGAALGIVVATLGCFFLYTRQKRRANASRVNISHPVPLDTYSDARRSDTKNNPFETTTSL